MDPEVEWRLNGKIQSNKVQQAYYHATSIKMKSKNKKDKKNIGLMWILPKDLDKNVVIIRRRFVRWAGNGTEDH